MLTYTGPLAMMPVIACFKVYRIFNKYNNTLHSPYIANLGPYRPRLPSRYVAEQKQESGSGHEQEPKSGQEQEPESGAGVKVGPELVWQGKGGWR